MDRVAQLAESAEGCLRNEKIWSVHLSPESNRAITRETLAQKARSLGFPENEISAAIDTALGGR